MAELCPDCGRPFATSMPSAISPKGPCARNFHPVGADDCAALTIDRLRRELDRALARVELEKAATELSVDAWAKSESALAEASRELAAARAVLDNLPDRFSHSVFHRAGLTLNDSSTALMVSRRVLEDAETERYEAARAVTAEPKENP